MKRPSLKNMQVRVTATRSVRYLQNVKKINIRSVNDTKNIETRKRSSTQSPGKSPRHRFRMGWQGASDIKNAREHGNRCGLRYTGSQVKYQRAH
eukprot:5783244-Pyramimonas_sp.AAC.1